MRIQLISHSPLVNSGYGRQAAVWSRQWRDAGHEVFVQTTFGHRAAATDWEGITLLPCSSNNLAQGMDLAEYYQDKLDPDLVICLLDAFTLHGPTLKRMGAKSLVALWMPVDCLPMSRLDRNVLDVSGAVAIGMSQFGWNELQLAGYPSFYAPHGIDTQFWAPPDPVLRKAARDALGATDSTFVIGVNSSNGDAMDRKNHFIQLSAFAHFLRKCPDALCVYHTCPRSEAMDLEALAFGFLQLPRDRIIFPDQQDILTGVYTDTVLRNEFYAACDLGSQATAAEGFGLPVIEFQSQGIPVVTTAASATAETGAPGEHGALFVRGTPSWNQHHQAVWCRPSVLHVQAAYEFARAEWLQRDDPDSSWNARCQRARQHALSYDHNHVMEKYWTPLMKTLDVVRRNRLGLPLLPPDPVTSSYFSGNEPEDREAPGD